MGMRVSDLWKSWLLQITLLTAGILLSCMVTWTVYNSQQEKDRMNFEYLAKENFTSFQYNLGWHEQILASIGGLYLASDYVSEEEFLIFTKPSMLRYSSFDALGWIDYSSTTNSFNWGHVRPDFNKSVAGTAVAMEGPVGDLLRSAIHTKSTAYMVASLEKIPFYDVHREGGDPENHIFILRPVFSGDDLKGAAFTILDLEYFIKETADETELSMYELNVLRGIDEGRTTQVYNIGLKAEGAPYEFIRYMQRGDLSLGFHFTPSDQFIAQNKTNHVYIIFAALIALNLVFLYLRQMKLMISALRLAQKKAEETNRLKSDFLATMSHEIRTPMNGILGMAELVLGAQPPPRIERYARTIINSGESLLDIINDILDFSKIEAGKLELDPIAVNMMDVVDDVANLYAVKARDKAVEVVVRYVPGSAQFVYADPVRVRQVLNNLIGNAIKFTEKGHVVLSVEEDRAADLQQDEVVLKFTVEDSGIGIPKEQQLCIFQKFSQADNSTTRKYGGTGLGLSICKNLVELMGGDIGLESQPGAGTRFWFTLPTRRNMDEVCERLMPPSLKDIRVLIVDDLPVIRQLVSEQLRLSGMCCDVANSGSAALEKMKSAHKTGAPYQIVIVDYLMPEMNGEMLARAINDHEDLREACLVMLTAAGNPLADDHFAEKGFSAYIPKPISNQALVKSLAEIWSKYKAGHRDVLIRIDLGRHVTEGTDDGQRFEMPQARALVAEDNLVNQVFIKEVLEEMSCQSIVVSNGREALEMLKEDDSYDIVMMDCLMPVMDGFEATRAICELKQRGMIRADLPVVALTANAMKGDRDKCLAAGMDDYISKPVRKNDLKEKVYQWVMGVDAPEADRGAGADEPANIVSLNKGRAENAVQSQGVLDEQAVAEARNILKDKYEGMIGVFIDNCWKYHDEMGAALAQGDVESVIRPSHTIKSTSQQMGAVKLSIVAREIEICAKALHKGAGDEGQDIAYLQRRLTEVKSLLVETKDALERLAA